ncbi:hypothetical protein GALMADRAFT_741309 [Galerina marginata CBS 339.88]|uniref:F-box domain-containing protein n=1 Tax=Galerina marginata (strain CBS 339.88) TaxID=685588 RepID=A0A067SZ09_GALM3|nr:hypothetical protein GALMADRAFT_741309 [Galerina marginata CBS 339.88]
MDSQSTATFKDGVEIPNLKAPGIHSPIMHLSEELLTLILDTVRHSFDDESNASRLARTQVPIIASHVSRSWRFVALDNPLWWSTIMIISPWKTEVVEAYLQRSKQCPLVLSVVANPNDHEILFYTSEDYQRLFDLLFPHFLRCRSLDIRGVFATADIGVASSFFERFLHAELPQLEQVVIEADTISYDCPGWESNPIFDSAPRLRDLRFIGTGILPSFFLSTGSFSGHELSSLHLSRTSSQISFSVLLGILDACPLLTTLAIYDDVLVEWLGLAVSCNVPSLERLYILSNMTEVSELLLFLSAPKLKELIIVPVVVPDLYLLLTQSDSNHGVNPRHRFPALKLLMLAFAHSRAFESINSASVCFPEVECLVLANLYPVPFLDVFTSKNDRGGVIFPNLLDLALSDIDKSFSHAICDMQEFRIKHQHPLRTLYVDSASLRRLNGCKVIGATLGDNRDLGRTENKAFLSNCVAGDFWEDRRRSLLFTNILDPFVTPR